MTTATFYIGADNVTRHVETVKALETVGNAFDGFAFWQATGYWKGEREETLVVQIAGLDEEGVELARALARNLAEVLHQDAVALTLADESFELIKA